MVTGGLAQLQNPFTLAAGFNTIDLVYARQSVTLEFLELSHPVTPCPGRVTFPPEVVMTTDFTSFAVTPNQRAAANLLDAAQLDPGAINFISFRQQGAFCQFAGGLCKNLARWADRLLRNGLFELQHSTIESGRPAGSFATARTVLVPT